MSKIAVACDHGGYALKRIILQYLQASGLEYEDFGTHGTESCDYPDFANLAAGAVSSGACERGILICTTGIGMSMAANKVPGVRCALCTDSFMARMTRQHNDANVLALGSGVVGEQLALDIVRTFLETGFEGGRHARRVDKVNALDAAL